jgi:integrase/recombinase XerD
MGCDCQIWIVGRTPTGDVVPRQATGCTEIKAAEAVRDALVAQAAREMKGDAVHGPTIAECSEKYLASRANELGDRTVRQHRRLLDSLQRFCTLHGVYYMRELTADLLETFRVEGLPGLADTSKATAISKLRCFLRTAYERDWIEKPMVDKVKAHLAVYEQKEPYTDEEVAKILQEAEKLNGGTHGYAKHPKTFRLLLELMLATGLRVSDAVRFNPSALVKGESLWAYTYAPLKRRRTEKRKHIEAYVTDRFKKAVEACEWLSPKLPFYYGAQSAQAVYERMQSIGSRCGVADCRPHRLRDTFAVRKLLAGLQLEDVSRLLGHSSVKVTESYYAKWTAGRKLRLERLLAESGVDA